MAEILGKKTVFAKGREYFHLADVSRKPRSQRHSGGNLGIIRAGLSVKNRKSGQVIVCFFGDGATNNGIFFECLNMASLWKLPVVYVCENNLYGMSVSVERACAVQDLTKKAVAFDMKSDCVDGQDVLAVRDTCKGGLCKNGEGLGFIVANTYRYCTQSVIKGHRTREREKFWRERIP